MKYTSHTGEVRDYPKAISLFPVRVEREATMTAYISNDRIEELEYKYFNVLKDTFGSSLGGVLSQLHNHRSLSGNTTPDVRNHIEHSAENIVHALITERLKWITCSVPCAADSAFECGDSIVHLDVKTALLSETEGIAVEKNQTTYAKGHILHVGRNRNEWEPNLNPYERHIFNGLIPNLTYIIKFTYENTVTFAIEKIELISLPHGQLVEKFGGADILHAGKTKHQDGKAGNVRFMPEKIAQIDSWRYSVLYTRTHENQN